MGQSLLRWTFREQSLHSKPTRSKISFAAARIFTFKPALCINSWAAGDGAYSLRCGRSYKADRMGEKWNEMFLTSVAATCQSHVKQSHSEILLCCINTASSIRAESCAHVQLLAVILFHKSWQVRHTVLWDGLHECTPCWLLLLQQDFVKSLWPTERQEKNKIDSSKVHWSWLKTLQLYGHEKLLPVDTLLLNDVSLMWEFWSLMWSGVWILH